jgi:two-component system, NarL family, invasion response regulator UvrY
MVHLMICDDHPIFREGLRKIVGQSGDIVLQAETASGRELLDHMSKERCDVVVLDISLPDMNGLQVLKDLQAGFPRAAALVLSMHPEDQYAVRALKAGASGYMEKGSGPVELMSAIRRVAAGGTYISPALAERLALEVRQGSQKAPHETLSDREYQVMCMLASGKGTKDISKELSLSPPTVGTYRARIMRKLDVKNTAELVRYAIEHRLIE